MRYIVPESRVEAATQWGITGANNVFKRFPDPIVFWLGIDAIRMELCLFQISLIGFALEEFTRVPDSCDFEFLADKDFESLDLSDSMLQNKIKEIYSSLSRIKGISYVGATKVMHLSPKVFVMWDKKIRDYRKARTNPEGYVDFMRKMQQMHKSGRFENLQSGVTIPRAIDIHNLRLADSIPSLRNKS